MQLLQWLDLERNSDILKKTDQKMSEKLRTKNVKQSSVQSEAEDLLDDFDYDGTEELSDEEIEDLLEGLGNNNGFHNDDRDPLPLPVLKEGPADDFEYTDELDLTELLEEYRDDDDSGKPQSVPVFSILPPPNSQPDVNPKPLLQPLPQYNPPVYSAAIPSNSYETPQAYAYSHTSQVRIILFLSCILQETFKLPGVKVSFLNSCVV